MKDEVMGWNTNWVCLSWIHRQHHKLGNQEKKRNGNDPVPRGPPGCYFLRQNQETRRTEKKKLVPW